MQQNALSSLSKNQQRDSNKFGEEQQKTGEVAECIKKPLFGTFYR